MKVDKIIVLCILILSLIFVLQVQTSLANGPINETQFVEEVNENGKINFYSHSRIGKINDWARDTKFMLYHSKDTGYTINLELNDDFSAKKAEFSRYSKSIGQIPEDVADDAIEKINYTPTPTPTTPVPTTPVPTTPVPATPVPATPVPATPVPATPVPTQKPPKAFFNCTTISQCVGESTRFDANGSDGGIDSYR